MKKHGISLTLVHVILNAVCSAISDGLRAGEYVTIQNFGSFHPWNQTSRPVCNPKTGEAYMMEPRTSVKFIPGKGLFIWINEKRFSEKVRIIYTLYSVLVWSLFFN